MSQLLYECVDCSLCSGIFNYSSQELNSESTKFQSNEMSMDFQTPICHITNTNFAKIYLENFLATTIAQL